MGLSIFKAALYSFMKVKCTISLKRRMFIQWKETRLKILKEDLSE